MTTKHKLIILDRDGTLIKHVHYLKDKKLVELLDDVGASLKKLQDNGYIFAIATNQSVIGRKLASEREVSEVNERVFELLMKFGVEIKMLALCGHAPTDNCLCRKPEIAMATAINNFLGTTSDNTIVIGDSLTDKLFAQNSGAQFILIKRDSGSTFTHEFETEHWSEVPKLVQLIENLYI